MSSEADVYNAIRDQVRYARKKHPDTRSIWEMGQLLRERAAACSAAVGSSAGDDYQTRTAKLTIQVATIAIRMIQDHDLPLPELHDTSK